MLLVPPGLFLLWQVEMIAAIKSIIRTVEMLINCSDRETICPLQFKLSHMKAKRHFHLLWTLFQRERRFVRFTFECPAVLLPVFLPCGCPDEHNLSLIGLLVSSSSGFQPARLWEDLNSFCSLYSVILQIRHRISPDLLTDWLVHIWRSTRQIRNQLGIISTSIIGNPEHPLFKELHFFCGQFMIFIFINCFTVFPRSFALDLIPTLTEAVFLCFLSHEPFIAVLYYILGI